MSTHQGTLIGIGYSPWTRKARAALDHHGVPYRYQEYLPMLGEGPLRLRLRRPFGRVSVPAYFDIAGALNDSWEIAHRAEEIGSGGPLFPHPHRQAIADWNGICEDALADGRMRALDRMKDSPAAQAEQLPPFIPGPLRDPLRGIAATGIRYVARKYRDVHFGNDALVRALLKLDRALNDSGGPYIFGEKTYADLAMAEVFQFVDPLASPDGGALGPECRACWEDVELKGRFAHLVDWRRTVR